MSDPDFVPIMIDGQRARVPRANLAALMRQLDDDGVPFETNPPDEAAPAQRERELPPDPSEGLSVPDGPPPWQGPIQAQKPMSAMDMVYELGRRGMSALDRYESASDPAARALASETAGQSLGGATDTFRQDSFSPAAQEASRAARGHAWDVGKQVAPWMFPAGQALSWPARIALQAGQAGGFGAATTFADSNEQDLEARALEALAQGGQDALMGGAFAGGLEAARGGVNAARALANSGAQRFAAPIADAAESAALKARGRAVATPADLRKLAEGDGIETSMRGVGEAVERLGMNAPGRAQSALEYVPKAAAARDMFGAQVGELEALAAAEGVMASKNPVRRGLLDLLRETEGQAGSNINSRSATLRDLIGQPALGPTLRRDPAGRIAAISQDVTPSEMHAIKKGYEASGGYSPSKIVLESEKQSKIANRDAATLARKELYRAMGEASPEVAGQFPGAMQNYSDAAMIHNLARAKARAVEFGDASMADIGATSVGGFLGDVPGAAAGFMARRAGRSHGWDATANALHGVSGAARGIAAKGIPPLGMSPALTRGAQAGARYASDDESEAQTVMDEGRGYQLEARVIDRLNRDPASLGPYRQRLQEAQQSEDPMRMVGVLSDLVQDAQFKTTVGRSLMAETRREVQR